MDRAGPAATLKLKLADKCEQLQRENAKLVEQLSKHQAANAETLRSELERKVKQSKAEQSYEQSLKGLREKLRQQENTLKLKEAELREHKAKIVRLESAYDQSTATLHKYKAKGVEKECETKLAEKDRTIRFPLLKIR